MAPPIRTPRSTWIAEGLRALAAGGPDAVRIEPLARALGVTRGGFYWHFADREALLDALLDEWERSSIDEVLERVERAGGDARAKIRRAGPLTFSDWLLPIDLAIRDWARRDDAVAARLRRVDNRRMDYLRSLFATLVDDADDGRGPQPDRLLAADRIPPDHRGPPRPHPGTGPRAGRPAARALNRNAAATTDPAAIAPRRLSALNGGGLASVGGDARGLTPSRLQGEPCTT